MSQQSLHAKNIFVEIYTSNEIFPVEFFKQTSENQYIN